MIKRIFTIISKKLNTIIKFINIRILKRKKAITVIDFLYLVLSKFQETKLFKVLIIFYRTMGILLALISAGVFYKENFNLNDLNGLLGQIKNTIITIYTIIYNTIILIYKIIFQKDESKNNSDESTPEPVENHYIKEIKDYFFKEETAWYQEWYTITGGIILLL